MQIFNIGPLELFFIVLIALIVLGPERLVSTAHTIGRFVNKVRRSPMWSELQETSQELRELPTRFVRDAGLNGELEMLGTEVKKMSADLTLEPTPANRTNHEPGAQLAANEPVVTKQKNSEDIINPTD